jgi:hypothetical protein
MEVREDVVVVECAVVEVDPACVLVLVVAGPGTQDERSPATNKQNGIQTYWVLV